MPINRVFGVYISIDIYRQKIKNKETTHSAIPIGGELKLIIEESRDNTANSYVVCRFSIKKSLD